MYSVKKKFFFKTRIIMIKEIIIKLFFFESIQIIFEIFFNIIKILSKLQNIQDD